jgi:hypothetical protein
MRTIRQKGLIDDPTPPAAKSDDRGAPGGNGALCAATRQETVQSGFAGGLRC